MDLDKKSVFIWDQAYELASASNLWGEPPVPFVKKAIEIFQEFDIEKIIDLPCGDGRNTIPLSEKISYIVAGDISINALRITNQLLKRYDIRNCLTMKVDVFETPFVEDQFEGVFCCDLLGHLKNPIFAIKEMLRICKAEGRIVASIFAMDDSIRGFNMRLIGNEEYIYDEKFYFKFYTQEEVLNLLKNIDCKIISVENYKWKEPPHKGYREYPHEHESWVFVIGKEEH